MEYAVRFNDALAGKDADIEGTIASFADCFIEASPLGVTCGKNDAGFREAIPQGYAFYKSIGTSFVKIANKSITLLDDMHAMVKIRWLSAYQKKNDHEVTIEFDVFYFVQQRVGLKIFAYVTGDEQKVFRGYGLI